MKSKLFLFLFLFFIQSFVAQTQPAPNKSLAFPGAEGFGKYTTGGRGGKVIIVSNLNDNGAGSFRSAVNNNDTAIIVFKVSGTIHLLANLVIKSNKTIAGQSAPGDGICLADYPVSIGGDNIIVRYMRFRMGDRYQNKGKIDGAGGDDAFGGTRHKNIIIDHCSMSWSTDEVCSIYAGDSTTIQWNIISEPLNYSWHYEKGDSDFEHHGYGSILGGAHTSVHHNLYAHCASRTPRFNGIRSSPVEFVDYRNNVIYNWVSNNVYAGEGGNYNLINNYYKPGPSTMVKVKSQVVNPYKTNSIPYGKFFIHGNYMDGNEAVTSDNWLGVTMEKGNAEDATHSKVSTPFTTMDVNTQTALDAFALVIKNAGDVFPVRDTLDKRILRDVENSTGKLIDVQGGYPHGTPYEISKHAWPVLKSLPPLPDVDFDGMPDEWERQHGLDPNVANDASGYTLSKEFTNVETWLNGLVE
jgi:hypothetical protein